MSVAEPVRSLCDRQSKLGRGQRCLSHFAVKNLDRKVGEVRGRFIKSRPAQSMALMFLIPDCHPVLQIEAYQDAGFERKASEMVMGAGVVRECRFCL
jgi:hypothetical protein